MFYIENPVTTPYSKLYSHINTQSPQNKEYEKNKDLLTMKSTIDIHNKTVTISIIQILVSIALLISSISLIIATICK